MLLILICEVHVSYLSHLEVHTFLQLLYNHFSPKQKIILDIFQCSHIFVEAYEMHIHCQAAYVYFKC